MVQKFICTGEKNSSRKFRLNTLKAVLTNLPNTFHERFKCFPSQPENIYEKNTFLTKLIFPQKLPINVECSFSRPAEEFLPLVRMFLAELPKIKTFNSFKVMFFLKMATWTRKLQFDNPATKFPSTVCHVFAQSPKVF